MVLSLERRGKWQFKKRLIILFWKVTAQKIEMDFPVD